MSIFPENFESIGARTQKLRPKNKSETKVWHLALSVSYNHPDFLILKWQGSFGLYLDFLHYNIHLWWNFHIFLVHFVFDMNFLHFFLKKFIVISNSFQKIWIFFTCSRRMTHLWKINLKNSFISNCKMAANRVIIVEAWN